MVVVTAVLVALVLVDAALPDVTRTVGIFEALQEVVAAVLCVSAELVAARAEGKEGKGQGQ